VPDAGDGLPRRHGPGVSLDDLWHSAASENAEARAFLDWYRENLPVFDALATAIQKAAPTSSSPPRPESLPFATEFEIENRTGLLERLATSDNPRRHAEQQTELFRMLADVHPGLYRRALISWLARLAGQLEDSGRLEDAYTCAEEMLGHCRRVEGPDHDQVLVRCLYDCVRLLLRLDRPAEALERLRESCTLVGADERTLAIGRRELSTLLNVFAEDHLRTSRPGDALPYLAERVEILRLIVEDDPGQLPALAKTLNNLGSIGFDQDPAAGRAAVAEAVSIRRALVESDPDAHLPGLAVALYNLGNVSARSGDLQLACSSLMEAVSIRRRLAAAAPDTFLLPLLKSLDNLGWALSGLGRVDEMLATTTEASTLARRLAASDPRYAADAGHTLLDYVEVRLQANRQLDEAREVAREVLTTYGDLLLQEGQRDRMSAMMNQLQQK